MRRRGGRLSCLSSATGKFAALSWGLVCQTMGALWHSGNGDVERAAVAADTQKQNSISCY